MVFGIRRIAKIFALMGLLSLSSLAMAGSATHSVRFTVTYHGASFDKAAAKTFDVGQCTKSGHTNYNCGPHAMMYLPVDLSVVQYSFSHMPHYHYSVGQAVVDFRGALAGRFIYVADHSTPYIYKTFSPFCANAKHIDVQIDTISSATCDGHFVLVWRDKRLKKSAI